MNRFSFQFWRQTTLVGFEIRVTRDAPMHACSSSNALVVGAPAAKETQSKPAPAAGAFVPSNPRIIIHYSTYSVPLWVF
jgi:hypothetical protein